MRPKTSFSQFGMALIAALFLLLGTMSACRQAPPTSGETLMNMGWKQLDNNEMKLPAAIEVWEGEDDDLPLRAWYLRIDPTSADIDIEVLSSNDSDGRQSAVEFAQQVGACVVVNGGYFKELNNQYSHIGLLIADGEFVHGATPGIYKDDIRYPVLRSAIGFNELNQPEIGWVSSSDESAFIWDAPISNAPGTPGLEADADSAKVWSVRDAIEAGPALLVNGSSQITVDQEAFFGTTIPDTHPRTAAGVDADGNLLLMIVDGRQRNSRGVSLTELAGLMKEIGAVNAMNLDGGGSSTLIVKNELLNLPTGGTFQREIVSAIGIHCLNESN
ncbi:phosphodiester glycosidase family protein [bacterium]|nr:phosphodiester glycosidase family protein [bacterium]